MMMTIIHLGRNWGKLLILNLELNEIDVVVDVDEGSDDESISYDEEGFSYSESSISSLNRELENIDFDSESDYSTSHI